jgi:WD40 repeat protein
MTDRRGLFPIEAAIGSVADSIRFRQTVKFFSVLFITLLLFNSCEEPHLPETPNLPESPNLDEPKIRNAVFDAAIDAADLQFRRNASGERIYRVHNQKQPYTGWGKNIRKLQQFRDGKKHGIYISWYGNWQKAEQGQYKNGVQDGLWIQWDPMGQKEGEGVYKDGNRHALWTLWYPNGQKESEITYENGSVLTSATYPQAESDGSDLDRNTGDDVPLAYVLRKRSRGKAQVGLPEGAKRRFGKGAIKDFQYSPDGNYLVAATAVGIWLYDGRTGEELGMPGYTDYVENIAFSPDGRTFASQNKRTAVCLWDTNTGKQKRILASTGASVKQLRFSPDGRILASANISQRIDLWNPHTGEHRLNFTGDNMSFSPDGSTLVTVSGNDIRLSDTLTGQHKQTFTGHRSGIRSVLFSPDGSMLASRSKHGTVSLWNTRTGKQTDIQHWHTNSPFSFSPDGTVFASGNRDKNGTVSLWNIRTGEQQQTLSGHEPAVSSVSFSPDGSMLASGGADGTIYLWDLRTGQHKNTFTGYTTGYQRAHQSTKAITRLAFNPDGTTLVSECVDTTVRLWNIDTGEHKNIRTGDNTAEIYSLSMSPDGAMLASGGNDGIIRLWDTHTGQRKRTLTGHVSIVSSFSFSPDSATLASGAWDNTIRLWDPRTGKQQDVLRGHAGSIESLSYSPDGEILASGDSKGIIRLWDVATRQQKRVLKGHTSQVYSIAFSPDGQTLASGEQDKTMHLWNVETGERKKTITDHTHYVSAVLFSPDGKTLISGSWDDTIRLWDAHTGEHKKTLVWDVISCLSMSPDGEMLASGGVFSRRNSITPISLWDVQTGKQKKTFMGHTKRINGVLFSPDGETLASASRDGTILLWDLTSVTNAVEPAK